MSREKLFKKKIVVDTNTKTLFEQLEKEYLNELENNKSLNFKKRLEESTQEIIKQKSSVNIFAPFNMDSNVITEEYITEIVPEITPPKVESPDIDFISTVVNSITREESNKIKEDTNLFTNPDSKIPDIKSVQTKLKNLEDWVYKISAAGPGGGEVNFRWLDDVDRDTIGNTNQILRYNPTSDKFFFGQLSGDQGPINSLEFVESGAGVTPSSRTLEWNASKDCLNVYQDDGSTLQVGLETYIRVHNSTANTLLNGTIVQFSGVNGDNETPTCIPLLANSSFVSLYTIGVLTNDILSGESGRATTLGEVRNLNTTGSAVGETWNVGDLLWASPTSAGKLTNVQPTAPNPVISVAAVLKKSNTEGILLVRPTIFPRLFYGSFFDITNQVATANTINTPLAIQYSNTQISSGFHVANTSEIVAEHAGLYNYQFSLQVDSTNAGSAQNIWVWYRKNGQDVPSTASRITVNKDYKIIAWNFIESMHIGDNFQLMWATDSVDVKIVAPASTAFCPDIPSVILTVTQVNL